MRPWEAVLWSSAYPCSWFRPCTYTEYASGMPLLTLHPPCCVCLQLLLLENVRFYKEEEKNDAEFAKKVRQPAPTRHPAVAAAALVRQSTLKSPYAFVQMQHPCSC